MRSRSYTYHFTSCLLSACLLLSGCVLTMEDYTLLPEEERGVGRPYTYEDSLVTCTYEFQSGVLPLTSEALAYIVGAEDSTVYFYGHTPEKWLPKAGTYVSAGNSRLFPYGLGHRVLEVKRWNDMYAVRLTRASIDEIFKQLDIKMRLDGYSVPGLFLDEDVPDTLYDEDGNVLKVIPPDPSAPDRAPSAHGLRPLTRADMENTSLELSPDGHTVFDWSYVDAVQNPSTRVGEEVKDTSYTVHRNLEVAYSHPKYGDLKLVFDYENKTRKIIRSYYEENTQAKTSKQWSQDESTENTTFTAGIEYEKGLDPLGLPAPRDMDASLLKKMREKLKLCKLMKIGPAGYSPKIQSITIPFTIGVVPCAFIIKFDAQLSVTVGGYASFTSTETQEVWRTTVVKNGDKEVKTKELINKGNQSSQVAVVGSAGVSFNVRVAVGAMVGIRGTGVGFDVGMGHKMEFKLTGESESISSRTEVLGDSKVTVKCGLYFDFEAFLDFAGNNIWNGRYQPDGWEWWYVDYSDSYYPAINTKKTNGTYNYVYDLDMKGTVKHKRKLCFSQLWRGWFQKEGIVRPVLRAYKGTLEDYDYTDLKPVDSSKGKQENYVAEKDVVYEFEYESAPEEEIHFVPALYVEEEEKTYELRTMQTVTGLRHGDPVVVHIEAYQESVDEAKDTWEYISGEMYDTYRIADVLRVECTQKLWEVGVYLDLVDSHNRQQFKNLKVSMLKANDVDGPIQAADYKFRLHFSIPSSGRQRSVFGVPIYPIITIRPYAVIYKGDGLGTEEVKYSSKQFNLKFPYTTSHNYRGALEVTH